MLIITLWRFVECIILIRTASSKISVTFVAIIPYDFDVIVPVVNLSLTETKEHYPNVDFSLYSIVNSEFTACAVFESTLPQRLGLYYRDFFDRGRYTVLIPTGCTNGMAVIADFGRELNVPVISSAGKGTVLQNKERFPTLVRILPVQTEAIALCAKRLVDAYQWRTMTILCDTVTSSANVRDLCAEFTKVFTRASTVDGSYNVLQLGTDLSNPDNQAEYLLRARQRSRIIVLLVHPRDTLDMLHLAATLEMINSEHVYIIATTYPTEWRTSIMERFPNVTYSQMNQSILAISAAPLPKTNKRLDAFTSYVASRSRNLTEELTWEAICAHAALTSAAEMVNETISHGLNLTDGADFIRRMYNRNFSSLLEEPMTVDENGDRDGLYAVSGLSWETGDFETLWTYDAYGDILHSTRYHWVLDSTPPVDRPPCGYYGDDAECRADHVKELLPLVLTPCVALYIMAFGFYCWYRRRHYRKEFGSWRILPEEVYSASTVSSKQRHLNRTTIRLMVDHTAGKEGGSGGLVRYQDQLVWTRKFRLLRRFVIDRKLQQAMYTRKKIHHENIAVFYGVCVGASDVRVISEYAPEHSLQDLLHKDSAQSLFQSIKLFLVDGITAGMLHIHTSLLKVHGCLSASNCLIDRRLTVRINDFGLQSIRSQSNTDINMKNLVDTKMLYQAPEILRGAMRKTETQPVDVYAFSIVLHQILFVCDPFWVNLRGRDRKKLTVKVLETLELVRTSTMVPFRPDLEPVNPGEMPFLTLLCDCWEDDPHRRPDFKTVRRFLNQNVPGFRSGGSVVEDVMRRLESFTRELERQVQQKTATLDEEKKASDKLLAEILPKTVVDKLRLGQPILPEAFENATIGFTAVADFLAISTRSEPLMVVNFLHHMFRIMDDVLSHYDIYKVETISDSYMIASGVPWRNGDRHVEEAGKMAVELMLKTRMPIELRTMSVNLQLKIGLNTGTCAASVVGSRMLRYCLFGDSVNTASRMTSFGQARKIHVSGSFREHAKRHCADVFEFESRGPIAVKGKGQLETFWLNGLRQVAPVSSTASALSP